MTWHKIHTKPKIRICKWLDKMNKKVYIEWLNLSVSMWSEIFRSIFYVHTKNFHFKNSTMNTILASHWGFLLLLLFWYNGKPRLLLPCRLHTVHTVHRIVRQYFYFGFESIDCGGICKWYRLTNALKFTYSVCVNEKHFGIIILCAEFQIIQNCNTTNTQRKMRVWHLLCWHVSTLAIPMKSFAKTFHTHVSRLFSFIPSPLSPLPLPALFCTTDGNLFAWKLTTLCISRNCYLIFHLFVPLRVGVYVCVWSILNICH